jgi:hypothetical protein
VLFTTNILVDGAEQLLVVHEVIAEPPPAPSTNLLALQVRLTALSPLHRATPRPSSPRTLARSTAWARRAC